MTEEKLTQEIIDLANKWYEGDINEDEFKKQAQNLVKIDRYEQLMLGGVVCQRVQLCVVCDEKEVKEPFDCCCSEKCYDSL